MKTKEAPNKIYLQENTTTDCYGEFWPEWFEARAKDDDIEYTRTDAFIKKATEWLKKNADSYTWYNEFEGESGMIDEFIDDFKKYMKGE